MTKGRLLLVALAALFLASPVLSLRLDPNGYEGGRSRDALAGAERNTSAAAMVLGELRTSVADMLFIKTELYLHNGVAYMPHMEKELLSVSGSETAFEEHQGEVGLPAQTNEEEHAGTPSLIPTAADDFRGFIGQLHREVKPWRDPALGHQHTDGVELLPWYRMMTLSDPRNVRAYAIGSWWLKRINIDESIEFIEEGVKNNPDAFQLQYMRGQILYDMAREKEAAGEATQADGIYTEAADAFNRAAELVTRYRPKDGPTPNDLTWTEYMEEDARAALRMSAMMEREHGDPYRAVELANRYLLIVPDDGVLQRLASPLEQ